MSYSDQASAKTKGVALYKTDNHIRDVHATRTRGCSLSSRPQACELESSANESSTPRGKRLAILGFSRTASLRQEFLR